MSAGVAVEIDSRRLIQKMRQASVIWNPRSILAVVGADLLRWVDRNFKDEGTEGGWAPLAPSTELQRAQQGRAGKVLQPTGTHLRSSFVQGGQDNVFRLSDTEVAVGTATPFAIYHQEGAAFLPQRRLLPSKVAATEVAQKAIQATLDEMIRKANE